MKRFYSPFFRLGLTRMFTQSLFFSIATVGLLSSGLVLSSTAQAQNPPAKNPINRSEVIRYAKVLLAMEPLRQQSLGEIKKIIGGGDIPKIVCNDPKSLNSLPNNERGNARDIAVNYCRRSEKIVQDNGFSATRFNEITQKVQTDNSLKRQMSNFLLYLQKNPNLK